MLILLLIEAHGLPMAINRITAFYLKVIPLFNQYGIIPINPDQCLNTHLIASIKVTEWLLSEKGQQSIAGYSRDGHQLFFPNAR